MPNEHDKVEWVLRFATRLHQLQPVYEGHSAAALAMKQYETMSNRVPEKAAEFYLSGHASPG